MLAMRRGDHEAAWGVSDAVLASRDAAGRDDPRLPYHLRWVWNGDRLDNRHVLVRCYHGLGDTLQFARYLPALRARAASVTLEVQAALFDLFRSIPGADRVVPFVLDAPAPAAECDIEIMELAHALRLGPQAVLPPYLQADPLHPPAGGTGVCWQAGGWDPARSIPASLLAQALSGRPLVTLQPTPAPACLPVRNPQGCPARIAETAALIAGLERVVTVDTMVAHLAGALGRPTWLLLKHDADWRWMPDRPHRAPGQPPSDRSPWYPSMRLFRQPVAGDWQSVADEIMAAG